MRFFRLMWLAWGLTTIATMAFAKEPFRGVDDKWRCYQSPHFELFSHESDFASRDLLERLELLHAVFMDMAKLRERMPLPVTVYFFDDTRDFLAYTPVEFRSEDRTAGFYMRRPDRGVIVVSPQWDDDVSRRLIFHEYIHHLTDIVGDDPALWYREGIAEVFSTIGVEGKSLKFGDPVVEHVVELRERTLIPLGELLSANHKSTAYNETKRVGMFYAESWALMHYWYFGDLKLTPAQTAARDRFFRYIRSEGENGNPDLREKLFQEATGKTYRGMEEDLSEYIRYGRYWGKEIERPKLAPSSSYQVRKVPRDEIREQLASLDLRVNGSELGKLALLDAVGRNPGDFRAYEVLGMNASIGGDDNEARERWEKALAAGSRNPAIAHELAEIENRAWFAHFDLDYRMPVATAERIRQLLHRSIADAPDQWRAYEILAWVEATAAKPSPAEINLVQQHAAAMPNPDRLLLALAMIRVRFEDYPAARQIIAKLRGSSQRPDILTSCAALEDYIARHTTTDDADSAVPESAQEEKPNG